MRFQILYVVLVVCHTQENCNRHMRRTIKVLESSIEVNLSEIPNIQMNHVSDAGDSIAGAAKVN